MNKNKSLPKKLQTFQTAYDAVMEHNKEYKKKKRKKLADHTIRVMKIVRKICIKAKLPEDITNTAILAACFHDVEKLKNDKQHHELGFKWVSKNHDLVKRILNLKPSPQSALLYSAVADAVRYHKGSKLPSFVYINGEKWTCLVSHIGCIIGRIVRYADKLDKKNKGEKWEEIEKKLKKSEKYFNYKGKPKWVKKIEKQIKKVVKV